MALSHNELKSLDFISLGNGDLLNILKQKCNFRFPLKKIVQFLGKIEC